MAVTSEVDSCFQLPSSRVLSAHGACEGNGVRSDRASGLEPCTVASCLTQRKSQVHKASWYFPDFTSLPRAWCTVEHPWFCIAPAVPVSGAPELILPIPVPLHCSRIRVLAVPRTCQACFLLRLFPLTASLPRELFGPVSGCLALSTNLLQLLFQLSSLFEVVSPSPLPSPHVPHFPFLLYFSS